MSRLPKINLNMTSGILGLDSRRGSGGHLTTPGRKCFFYQSLQPGAGYPFAERGDWGPRSRLGSPGPAYALGVAVFEAEPPFAPSPVGATWLIVESEFGPVLIQVRSRSSFGEWQAESTTNSLFPHAFSLAGWMAWENISDEDFAGAVRDAQGDILAMTKSMLMGRKLACSSELLDLASRAAQQCSARKDEDVRTWAERLAREVSEATD